MHKFSIFAPQILQNDMKRLLKYVFIGTLALLGISTFDACQGEKPMKMNNPRNIRGVVSYKRAFNDLNDTHLKAAQAIGIRPIADREAAEQMTRKLDLVETCDYYTLDPLTHSIPFLVPKANDLLDNVGKNFLDSLENKGLNPYKVIVTSVLRTDADVKKLRKRNVNASDKSAHRHGTTFDISYKRFDQMADPDGYPLQPVREDTLKMVLAEVLRDLKKQGDCYVKYELKQGCFHITAR